MLCASCLLGRQSRPGASQDRLADVVDLWNHSPNPFLDRAEAGFAAVECHQSGPGGSR